MKLLATRIRVGKSVGEASKTKPTSGEGGGEHTEHNAVTAQPVARSQVCCSIQEVANLHPQVQTTGHFSNHTRTGTVCKRQAGYSAAEVGVEEVVRRTSDA